jgi:hypothetical protein
MLYFILGYAVCVVFPIPWLNVFIIGLWARLYTQLESWIKGTNTIQEPIIPPEKVAPAPTPSAVAPAPTSTSAYDTAGRTPATKIAPSTPPKAF